MADRDSRTVMIVAGYSWYLSLLGERCREVGRGGNGQWVLIDLCQSGLKSSASHGVHGQAVGVGRSVFEAAKRLAALGPHRLECDG